MCESRVTSTCSKAVQYTLLRITYSHRGPRLASQSDLSLLQVTKRGLAHITLLGDPQAVKTESRKLSLDISKARYMRLCAGYGTFDFLLVRRDRKSVFESIDLRYCGCG